MTPEHILYICRSPEKLRDVCHWAQSLGDDPYALGVLAALGYAFCKNHKTPAEIMGDAKEIRESASMVGWITSWEECLCDKVSAGCVYSVVENPFQNV